MNGLPGIIFYLLTPPSIDDEHSAKTFDRADFIKLKEFIADHQSEVDYLVVDQMDPFTMSLVKKLQLKYNIQIVSGLQPLLANPIHHAVTLPELIQDEQ